MLIFKFNFKQTKIIDFASRLINFVNWFEI